MKGRTNAVFKGARCRCRRVAAVCGLLTLFAVAGTEGRPDDAPALQLRAAQTMLRVQYQDIVEVVRLIHPLIGPQGWYRIQPGDKVLEVHDSPDRVERIRKKIEHLIVGPDEFFIDVTLMHYVLPESLTAAETRDSADRSLDVQHTPLIRRLARATEGRRERQIGQMRVKVREGQFVEFTLGEGYNIELRIGYCDKKKELIEIDQLTFYRQAADIAPLPPLEEAVKPAPLFQHDANRKPILSTGLNLEFGTRHLLTMRKPGSKQFFTLSIRAHSGKDDSPDAAAP